VCVVEGILDRAYYHDSAVAFRETDGTEVLGHLARCHGHALDLQQRNAWVKEIRHLQAALANVPGSHVFLEFAIPRMGKRADVILLLGGTVVVLEYKVGAANFTADADDQVLDYALDLKNFHTGSHEPPIVPVVVATEGPAVTPEMRWYADRVAYPIHANANNLAHLLDSIASQGSGPPLDAQAWLESTYKPTPTIVEASQALYSGHSVQEISRSDAGAKNLTLTAGCMARIIESAKAQQHKSICLVTGVPGSGKTLAGLNIASLRRDAHQDEHAVFLSGNGPLVAVLQEALARDDVARSKQAGERITKSAALQKARAFIQNIHHFRDDNLSTDSPPVEKVAVFDEAQRAWSSEQTGRFMREKRGQDGFDMSEPEFLLSVMDRHPDWCVVVCLIGGGQEINTGEAGLTEWVSALEKRFRDWRVHYSDRITGSEYTWDSDPRASLMRLGANPAEHLHLGVSVRSFRSEQVAAFVQGVIESDTDRARASLPPPDRYPIVLCRDLGQARAWLRKRARGSERFGLVASSNALRLKPCGLHVKAKINPANWFLNDRTDVRSSYALEDVATEFDIQGLELDWVGVCWDANFRHVGTGWDLYSFSGTRWAKVKDTSRRAYLANAYRVLLTRARQGMVLFVPRGDREDATRQPEYYERTYSFLRDCGIPDLGGGADS